MNISPSLVFGGALESSSSDARAALPRCCAGGAARRHTREGERVAKGKKTVVLRRGKQKVEALEGGRGRMSNIPDAKAICHEYNGEALTPSEPPAKLFFRMAPFGSQIQQEINFYVNDRKIVRDTRLFIQKKSFC